MSTDDPGRPEGRAAGRGDPSGEGRVPEPGGPGEDRQRPGARRPRRVLGMLRVSGYNTTVAAIFIVLGIVLMLTTDWGLSLPLMAAGALQYLAALFVRASGLGGDVLRVTFFEPTDERDRLIRLRASAIVGDTVSFGSLVVFIVALVFAGEQSVLTLYLALQTIVVNLFWVLVIWIVARRS